MKVGDKVVINNYDAVVKGNSEGRTRCSFKIIV